MRLARRLGPRLRRRSSDVRLRPFPHPYEAMLAISTDIDHASVRAFREIHRFLNTHETTSMGPGLGLDIADSMWFYRRVAPNPDSPTGQLAYFAADDWSAEGTAADELVEYARCGWVDTLHSYGDFSQARRTGRLFTREHALRALEVCERHGLELPVWVNHGSDANRQNVGGFAYMEGDDERSPAYHTDLFPRLGVRYLASAHTGEDTMPSPLESGKLRDGRRVWRFRRSASLEDHPDAPGLGRRFGVPFSTRGGRSLLSVWHPRALHLQVTPERLERLATTNASVVFAQHLGSIRPLNRLGAPAIEALHLLREWEEAGRVATTRTSRLLEYHRVRDHLVFDVEPGEHGPVVDLRRIDDPVIGAHPPDLEELRGITFYADDPRRVRLTIGGAPVDESLVERYPHDGVAPSVGIRWHEPDRTDHSAPFRERVGRPRTFPVTSDGAPRSAVPESVARKRETLRQIGYAERDGSSRILCLEPEGDEWSTALATADQAEGVSILTDNPASRAPGVVVIDDGGRHVPRLPGPPKRVGTVLATDLARRGELEVVARALAKRVKAKGHAYVVHRGPGAGLRQLADALEIREWETAREAASTLRDSAAYRAGLGRVPARRRLVDYEDAFRVLDLSGFRYLDEPGAAEGGRSFAGFDGVRDLLLEKNPNGSRKYRRESPVEELLGRAERGAAWFAVLRDLVDAGVPRLVVETLRAVEDRRTGRLATEWAATYVAAHVKRGLRARKLERDEAWIESLELLPSGHPVRSLAEAHLATARSRPRDAHEAVGTLPADARSRPFLLALTGEAPDVGDAAGGFVAGDPWSLGVLAASVCASMEHRPEEARKAVLAAVGSPSHDRVSDHVRESAAARGSESGEGA